MKYLVVFVFALFVSALPSLASGGGGVDDPKPEFTRHWQLGGGYTHNYDESDGMDGVNIHLGYWWEKWIRTDLGMTFAGGGDLDGREECAQTIEEPQSRGEVYASSGSRKKGGHTHGEVCTKRGGGSEVLTLGGSVNLFPVDAVYWTRPYVKSGVGAAIKFKHRSNANNTTQAGVMLQNGAGLEVQPPGKPYKMFTEYVHITGLQRAPTVNQVNAGIAVEF